MPSCQKLLAFESCPLRFREETLQARQRERMARPPEQRCPHSPGIQLWQRWREGAVPSGWEPSLGSLDTFYTLTLLCYSAWVYSVCFTSPVLTFTVLLLHGPFVQAIMTPVCRLTGWLRWLATGPTPTGLAVVGLVW